MRYSATKSYPHPVLRDGSSDYLDAEFKVDLIVEVGTNSMAIEFQADFVLSDHDLEELVGSGNAEYLLLVRCDDTFLRQEFRSHEPTISGKFRKGQFYGSAEFTPFLVIGEKTHEFKSSGWNEDYAGQSYTLEPGSVLATAPSESYWIDRTSGGAIGSIFKLATDEKLESGMWYCNFESEQIRLMMSPDDKRRFTNARKSKSKNPDLAYILNGIYLPALIWALTFADVNSDDYEGRRWFANMEDALEKKQLKSIGDSRFANVDRSRDAQKLFDFPLARLLGLFCDEKD